MKNFIVGFLIGAVFAIGLSMILVGYNKPKGNDSSEILKLKSDTIELYSMKVVSLRDSLEASDGRISALLGHLNAQSTEGSAKVEKVKHLSPDSSVNYFNEHTGEISTLNSDSTVTATIQAITNANILFQTLDNELDKEVLQVQLIGELQTKISAYAKFDTTQQNTIDLLKGTVALWQMENAVVNGKLAERDKTIHALKKYVLILSGSTGLFFVLLIL